MSQYRFGVLTVSDTCSLEPNKDKSGPKLKELINEKYPNASIKTAIVKDDKDEIKSILGFWTCELLHVIITTGGTGLGPRDVTPEATKEIIEREAPGLIIAIITDTVKSTKLAMLSRGVCGITRNTLIINFPGKLNAVVEYFNSIKNVIPHAIDLINNDLSLVKSVHNDNEVNSTIGKSKVQPIPASKRVRVSQYKMFETLDAMDLILNKVPRTNDYEIIDLSNAIGRKLWENVFSTDPLPPFRASIKDGYAINKSKSGGDFYEPSIIDYSLYKIKTAINAGDCTPIGLTLNPGEAVRISTGAPVPDDANAVVKIEDTVGNVSENGKEVSISVEITPLLNQDIREIGSDMPANELILKKEMMIDIGVIGVLATIGKSSVKVFKNPSVGIISTGNELQDYNEPLASNRIRDTNKITLMTLLKKYNFDSNDCGIIKDTPDDLKAAFDAAFLKHDIIVTTGGVSMGEFDFVKKVLETDFNAIIHFGRVNMKPGLPTTFATCMYHGEYKMIFALPGNPVSAAVTAHLFVIPALRYYANHEDIYLPTINVIFGEKRYNLDSRPEFARAYLKDNKAYLLGNQISSRVNSLAGATILLKVPSASEKQSTIVEGDELEAILIK